jgi:RimJ/RimL family protein N-acetyltransferase
MNDPEVTVTLARHEPISMEQELAWFRGAMLHEDPSELVLAICLKEDSRHVGMIGLHRIHPVTRVATLGMYIGDKSLWRQGLGSDALRTICRYGFERLHLHKIRLEVYPFNPRAEKIYESVGFRREGVFREEGFRNGAHHDVIRMGLLASELP